MSYTYEGDHYEVFLEINPLTRKVELHVSSIGEKPETEDLSYVSSIGEKPETEDLSSLVGEPSDIIFGALESFAIIEP